MDEERCVWFCYMLYCGDGSFYAGITNDLDERLAEHARGKDSDYTAKRRPVRLVWSEPFASREEARKREVEIKGWSRRKKLRLVGGKPSPAPAARPQGKGALALRRKVEG